MFSHRLLYDKLLISLTPRPGFHDSGKPDVIFGWKEGLGITAHWIQAAPQLHQVRKLGVVASSHDLAVKSMGKWCWSMVIYGCFIWKWVVYRFQEMVSMCFFDTILYYWIIGQRMLKSVGILLFCSCCFQTCSMCFPFQVVAEKLTNTQRRLGNLGAALVGC